MRSVSMLFHILLFSGTCNFAQKNADTLYMERYNLNYDFYCGNEPISFKQMVRITKSNPEAYAFAKKAKRTRNFAKTCLIVPSILLLSVASSVTSTEEIVALAAITGAGIVASIPLYNKANKKARTAINIYNEAFRKTSGLNKFKLDFICTNKGLGFILQL